MSSLFFYALDVSPLLTPTSDSSQIPALYDSRGILSTLDRFRRPGQARWIPALDTFTLARREGKEESYWAVGVQGGKFMAVILKVRLPSTSP